MADTRVIVIPEGKISDYIDGKFRNDTPEEYVRQTIEKRLVNEHKYSTKQIKIEYTLQLGSNKPRADIVIFDKNKEYAIDKNTFLSKGKNTPFHGRKVKGEVAYTLVSGNVVYER